MFLDTGFAEKVLRHLVFGNHGADAGLGKECGDAHAAGPDPFGQRSLRIEFELKLSEKIQLLE